MCAASTIFVEAEQFGTYGGWVLDQQFMAQMGSAYLLAHGLGKPVADAVTTVNAPVAGTYRVWVRTFDWVARWDAPGTPGAFQLFVNGTALGATFGTQGADWSWQDGGTVTLGKGPVQLALHDLMGFDGRCDAILFTTDLAYVPVNDGAELAILRRRLLGLPEKPEDAGSFDFVVVGGGIAGMCAAVAAARKGLTVALVQDRPVLGGNNSAEVRVQLGGETNFEPFPRIGDLTGEIDLTVRAPEDKRANMGDPAYDAKRSEWLVAERGVRLFAPYRAVDAVTEGGSIRAVIAQDVISGRRIRLGGALFADCTGDGDLGALAGADFDMTTTSHMGPTNVWGVADSGRPEPFPRCPWALDLTDKPFPGRGEHSAQWGKPGLASLGLWFWENGFDLDPIREVERMRDTNFRAMYGAWDALKNVDGLYPTHRISWAAYITGKRESRRLMGDVVVTRGDLFRQKRFEDGCVPCTWHMDLHVPHRDYQAGFEGEEFISWCVIGDYPRPHWLPYRALYSRNIGNLYMAGRDVSVTHEALGTVRVIRTCGMMGEVIGLAAALCRELGATPRSLYQKHWDVLQGVLVKGVPARQ